MSIQASPGNVTFRCVITNIYSATLPDKTKIEARIKKCELLVTVLGPAYSIAECGEQLAWLAAALSPLEAWPTHRTPTITEASITFSSDMNSSTCKLATFDIKVRGNLIESNMANAHCPLPLIRISSIVLGFPTARRPENYVGLEIDKEMLLSCTELARNGLLLHETGKRLLVFKQTENVLLWHLCSSSSRPCSCCITHLSRYGLGSKGIGSLDAPRHIIYQCGIPDSFIVESELPSSTTTRGIVDDSGEDHMMHKGRPSRFKGISSSVNSSQSRIATDSTDVSFESDLFSESGSSNIEPLDSNDHHFSVLNSVLHSLLLGFREATEVRTRAGQSKTSETGSGAPKTTSESVCVTLPRIECRKRQRQQKENGDSENEDMSPPSKRITQLEGRKRQQQLACPYWKRNSSKHRGCFSKTLRRIRDVKQHLSRKHTPEFYCECCFAIFTDGDEHQIHITHVTGEVCTRGPSAVLDGVSHQQHRQLSRKSDSKLSEQEQWFSVWDTLFPGSQRPTSAYLDSELSAEISGFREYCFQYGPSKLGQALEGEVPETEKRRHLMSIIQAGLNQLFDAWHSNCKSSRISPDNAQSSTSQSNRQDSGTQPPQCQPTPSSSLDTSVLTTEYPVSNASQIHDSMPNPLPVPTHQHVDDMLRPFQLSRGDFVNGYSQPFDQGIPNNFQNFSSQTWPRLNELGLGETSLDPNACNSAMPNSNDLDIEELLNFDRSL